MSPLIRTDTIRRVAFVSSRISGTDGVSLEAKKWAEIIGRLGPECYCLVGESDQAAERTFLIDEARINDPVNQSD